MTRMIGDLIVKDPQSIEPQGVDWTDWLAEIGDSEIITASAYSITIGDDGGLTLSGDSIVTGDRKTQVLLTGGTRGVTYAVTNHITSSSGAQADGSFLVLVEPT